MCIRDREQVYGIPNMDLEAWGCYTDKAPAGSMRGVGGIQASFCMESIIEHVAQELQLPAQEVRERNLYLDLNDRFAVQAAPLSREIERFSAQMVLTEGKNLMGQPLLDYPALGMWEFLKRSHNVAARQAEVDLFNAAHRLSLIHI